MVYKNHYLEIYVNGNKLDVNQDAINIRFNNVLYDPEKISSSQAEYSFEFSIPDTPNNSKIFDYANNYSKLNKFRARFSAEVFADGKPIFTGTLTLNSYKDKQFNCNLVQVKVYSLDEIFGEDTLTKIPWKMDFDGVSTINERNAMEKTDVVFPLVNYGPFQKDPENSDSVSRDYTSKYIIDKWNKWYVESFYPSLNMLESLKKAFEYKGYTVGGDAFIDPVLNNIYMSCNLADEQDPVYNLGNPHFGKVEINTSFTSLTAGYVQDLKYPYYSVGGYIDLAHSDPIYVDSDWNYNKISIHDLLDTGATVSSSTYSYMYQPNEHMVVIPADGFYRIDMKVTGSVLTNSSLTAGQYVRDWNDNTGSLNMPTTYKDVTIPIDVKTNTPIEIALVRNYDDNYELIKGKYNLEYVDGYPDHTTQGGSHTQYSNYKQMTTCFPHEALGVAYYLFGVPTKYNELTGSSIIRTDTTIGYDYKDGQPMMYDQVVSPCFICGFSTQGDKTHGGGCASVMKNGYSWSKLSAEKNEAFYQTSGYQKSYLTGSTWETLSWMDTDFNANTYSGAPTPSITMFGNGFTGELHTLVRLNKNDALQLFGIQRDYTTTGGTEVPYSVKYNVELTIEAISDDSYFNLSKRIQYSSTTEFDTQLNLSGFMNKEKKISEHIQNILDAFNLELMQYDKSVEINVKKKFGKNSFNAINIDDRVNKGEIEAINYPKSMAVKYKINTEEHGFYDSIPEEYKNDNDRDKYGDSGYTKIILNDDSFVTTTSDKSLQYSYTWYDDFTWTKVDTGHTEDTGVTTTLLLPVICKEDYMADYANYEEDMKHDGYGLSQRFWFKPTLQPYVDPQMHSLPTYLYTDTYPQEKVDIYTPVNSFENVNLSYKNSEVSLLATYFNITPYLASNYVTVEVYITPEEYNQIKNGAMIEFDDDLYYVVEISGFDVSGKNETELKLLKRV